MEILGFFTNLIFLQNFDFQIFVSIFKVIFFKQNFLCNGFRNLYGNFFRVFISIGKFQWNWNYGKFFWDSVHLLEQEEELFRFRLFGKLLITVKLLDMRFAFIREDGSPVLLLWLVLLLMRLLPTCWWIYLFIF